jgi:hypothetical protein
VVCARRSFPAEPGAPHEGIRYRQGGHASCHFVQPPGSSWFRIAGMAIAIVLICFVWTFWN